MHFGEYELSPSLISLSPLPSAHPEAFQRLLVRSSSWCYPAFNLAKGRSLGFASATADYTPYSDSLSLRIRVSSHLTLPAKATRRFIMQKAHHHIKTADCRFLRVILPLPATLTVQTGYYFPLQMYRMYSSDSGSTVPLPLS